MAHGSVALHNRTLKFKPSCSLFFLGNPCHTSISLNYSPSSIFSLNHPRLCAQSRDKCVGVKEIARLKALRKDLVGCRTFGEKLKVVNSDSRVEFFKSRGNKFSGVGLCRFQLYLLKFVVAAGQEHMLSEFGEECELETSSVRKALYPLAERIENWDVNDRGKGEEGLKEEKRVAFESPLKLLREVEQFYDRIAGICNLSAVSVQDSKQSIGLSSSF